MRNDDPDFSELKIRYLFLFDATDIQIEVLQKYLKSFAFLGAYL